MRNKRKEQDQFIRDQILKGHDYKAEIEQFGHYRMGLAANEIDDYLRIRSEKSGAALKKLRRAFNKVAGCNTCAVGPGDIVLMYRWDVVRFANVVLLGASTYFD